MQLKLCDEKEFAQPIDSEDTLSTSEGLGSWQFPAASALLLKIVKVTWPGLSSPWINETAGAFNSLSLNLKIVLSELLLKYFCGVMSEIIALCYSVAATDPVGGGEQSVNA